MDWISVEDKLPRLQEDVICRVTNGPYPIEIAHLEFWRDTVSRFYNHYGQPCYITHWMPLPGLPKEGP